MLYVLITCSVLIEVLSVYQLMDTRRIQKQGKETMEGMRFCGISWYDFGYVLMFLFLAIIMVNGVFLYNLLMTELPQ